MQWIAVHEDVLGSKLRGLRKRIQCSDAEALGILTVLWLWARKNADMSGLLGNTDRDDIASAIRPHLNDNLNASSVTEALIEEGWLDEVDGKIFVHDWYEWQHQWYDYLGRKEKDRQRKQAERERKKAKETENEDSPNKSAGDIEEEKTPQKRKTSKSKVDKIHYAEFVSMTAEEHQRLVDKYGEAFTAKCIETLDNYKGSKGKTYKDDYRAILSWVVEECEKRYPNLKKQAPSVSDDENPFASYL